MSAKGVELLRLAERGERVAKVRESLAMSGEQFAEAVNQKAAAFGYDAAYDKSKVSRLEAGKTTFLPAEEAVLIALLDPERRSMEWLVFGREKATGRGAKPIPTKAAAAPSSRTIQRKRDAK